MRKQILKSGYLAAAALLSFAGGAFAQCMSGTTCVQYTGASGYSLSGGVVGPQTANVTDNGPTTEMYVISTDYSDSATEFDLYNASFQTLGALDTAISPTTDNYDNTSWGAAIALNTGNVYGTADGSNDPMLVYEAAAYLASTMVTCAETPSCTNDQAAYQQAIWDLMDPGDLTNIFDYTAGTCPNADVCTILNSVYDTVVFDPSALSAYSGVLLITPTGTPTNNGQVDPTCGTAPNTGCDPEFFAFSYTPPVVSTPESSEPLILGADLLGLVGIAFMFRRRLIRVKR